MSSFLPRQEFFEMKMAQTRSLHPCKIYSGIRPYFLNQKKEQFQTLNFLKFKCKIITNEDEGRAKMQTDPPLDT